MLGTRPRVRKPTNHGAAARACIMHDPRRGTNCIYATRYSRVSLRMTLSDFEWLSEIFNDIARLSATAELLVRSRICRRKENIFFDRIKLWTFGDCFRGAEGETWRRTLSRGSTYTYM